MEQHDTHPSQVESEGARTCDLWGRRHSGVKGQWLSASVFCCVFVFLWKVDRHQQLSVTILPPNHGDQLVYCSGSELICSSEWNRNWNRSCDQWPLSGRFCLLISLVFHPGQVRELSLPPSLTWWRRHKAPLYPAAFNWTTWSKQDVLSAKRCVILILSH